MLLIISRNINKSLMLDYSEKKFVDCSFEAVFGETHRLSATNTRGHMEVCGHRGGFKPQNSLEAFS
jgi:hypothetical protein